MSNEVSFQNVKESIEQKARQIIDKHLQKRSYTINDAKEWTNTISKECVNSLTEISKNFKYMVNCIIMQKSDCGLNVSGSCYWDNESDGNVCISWDSPSMICVVNIFGVAL